MKTSQSITRKGALWLALAFGLATMQAVADDGSTEVIWQRIVGIVEPQGIVGLPSGADECEIGVNCVQGTVAPWTVTAGRARVDLAGDVQFTVRGLVLAGDPSFTNIGTRGVVTKIKGTLVCNDTEPGVPELVDTEGVRLSLRGDATFRGHVDLPPSCTDEPDDIVFLIRIVDVSDPNAVFLIDLWNAFGAVRTRSDELDSD
jgi:hypothetical protein